VPLRVADAASSRPLPRDELADEPGFWRRHPRLQFLPSL